ncbi:hypothetical protein Ocin01_18396 [Orchesella cincta]|uniref:Protein quiver n=1 Tax=Orchesella cincta TaxID=48709 RepID=A0A1D2M5N4_ORCCI|nr:hypothetical protein Ocin01_18396 [Orchesella cincta]
MKTFLNCLILCLVFAVVTEGLRCYNCYYFDSEYQHENIPNEVSCALGQAPESTLSFDCSTLQYDLIPNNKEGIALGMPFSINPRSNRSQRSPPPPNAVFSCVTMHFNGTYTELFDNKTFIMAARGCIISYQNQTIDEQCHEGKLKDLISTVKQEELLDLLVDFNEGIDENVTDISICNCNGNNCNTESGVTKLDSRIGLIIVFAVFSRKLSSVW